MEFIVTPVGLEPTTYGLEGHCFYPIELRGYLSIMIKLRIMQVKTKYSSLLPHKCYSQGEVCT